MRFVAGGARRQGREVLAAWRSLLLCLLVAGLIPAGSVWAQTAPSRNVLVLFSNGRLLPANVEIDRGLSEGFASRPDMHAELSVEFLDAPKFSGPAHADTVAAYLRDKYAASVPEAIIAIGPEALEFVLSKREQMFPDASVVHMFVSAERLQALAPLPSDVIGVPLQLDFLGTAELALRLHPSARRLVVVTGAGEWDRNWEARVRREAAKLETRLSVEYLAGLSSSELRTRLGQLPADSIVFTPGWFRDGDGRLSTPGESAKLIAAASAAPVYAPYPGFIGSGIVGGSVASFDDGGRLAAQVAIALLDGAAPASVALPQAIPNRLVCRLASGAALGHPCRSRAPRCGRAFQGSELLGSVPALRVDRRRGVPGPVPAHRRPAGRTAPAPAHGRGLGAERAAHEPGGAGGTAVDVDLGLRAQGRPALRRRSGAVPTFERITSVTSTRCWPACCRRTATPSKVRRSGPWPPAKPWRSSTASRALRATNNG